MNNLSHALLHAMHTLEQSSENPRMDAEILLAHILDKSRTYLYTHPELQLTQEQQQRFDETIAKRKRGHPVAYLTHTKAFWSLNLTVSPDTLIPRPETELLIELALQFLPAKAPVRILDLGTGTGAIALALAQERPHWEIHAYDCCEKAIAIAQQNASDCNLNQVQLGVSDWFDSIPALHFDAIISNPPYIEKSDPHLTQGDLRFEPKGALASGVDGLDALRILTQNAPYYLKPGGFLMLEHGYNQKHAVAALLGQSHFSPIQHFKDLQGHDRVTIGNRGIN